LRLRSAMRLRLERRGSGEELDACYVQGAEERWAGRRERTQGTVRDDRRPRRLTTEANNTISSDQLMLEDDPDFLPELDLLQVDLEIYELATGLDSMQDSSQIVAGSSQHSQGFVQDLGGALMTPPSASSFSGGPVGGGRQLSVRGDSGAGTRIGGGLFQQDEAHGMLEDDLGMQIDADGNFVLDEDMPTEPVRQPRAPSGPVDRTDLPSDPASARIRAEHAGGQQVSDFVSVVVFTLKRKR
jgi:hypothetical protein